MLRYAVQLCLMREHPGLSQRDLKLLSDFPVDPRTAEKEYNPPSCHHNADGRCFKPKTTNPFSELQHRGCEPIQADSRKVSRLTRADYARGILAWVRLLFFQAIFTY
jgi:hypothetical protein